VAHRAEVHAAVEARVAGGSNGGLTVGAVITQRPDLVSRGDLPGAAARHGAFPQIPDCALLDRRNMAIPTSPTPFRWILRYSPYQNVRQGVNLPETLVVAGEFDSASTRCTAKKFAALVQNNPGQVSPFLLYMDFDSGHGSGKTNQQRVIDRDYELRFLMNALGMNAPAASPAK
jgi:prolyl oligopeptidase